MLPVDLQKRSGLPSGTYVRQPLLSVPWVRGLWLKEGTAKEGTKFWQFFKSVFWLPSQSHFVEISALARPLTAAAGLDDGWPSRSLSLAHCAASWLRWSLILRVFTSVTWNPTHLDIEFSVQLKVNTRQVRERNISTTSSGRVFSVFGLPGMAQSHCHRQRCQHRLGTGEKHKFRGYTPDLLNQKIPGGGKGVGKRRGRRRGRGAQQPVF